MQGFSNNNGSLLVSQNMSQKKQKRVPKGVQGYKDNLLIDKSINEDARYFKCYLHASWLDYLKSYDTTSHNMMIQLTKTLKIHPYIIGVIKYIMELWKTKFAICSFIRGG